jgi:tetratricopeptide (TPR) repeat protein
MAKTREELDSHNLEELFERFRQSPEGYAFVPLADACRKMGRLEEALEICNSGVKRHPAYASGHVVRGKCLYDGGNRNGAREAFYRVLLLDENNLVALKYLGTIEADDGNFDEADKHLERILSFDPENKEIRSILRLVEEQAQIERVTEEPAATMEAVDEILAGAAPTYSPEDENDDDDELAPALSIEADLVVETRDAAPGESAPGSASALEDVETSDELASVTLADIFAEQGYKSKAAKIYREVLRKQPANDAVRARLVELTGTNDALTGTNEELTGGTGAPVEDGSVSVDEQAAPLPEIAEQSPPAGDVTEDAAALPRREAGAVETESAPAGEPSPEAESAEFPGADPAPAAGVSLAARPEIAEKESLHHFRHWLTKIRR